MVIINAHSKNIKIKYKNTLISKSTLVWLLSGIFSVVLPYILAYNTSGFWLKHDTFYEQPRIKFTGKYLFTARTGSSNEPIVCSNYKHFQVYKKQFDKCSTIKVREIDNDYDSLNDNLYISLEVDLKKKVYITSLNIIIPIDYKLDKTCSLQMQSLIIFQHNLNQPTSLLRIHGDISTTQSTPLLCHPRLINSVLNQSIIEDDSESISLENILTQYSERHLSTHLTNIYTVHLQEEDNFRIELLIKNPVQRFYFKPEFWHTMKYAWMQYYIIYVIISWFVKKLKNYIFGNRFVYVYEEHPIKQQ